MTTRERLKRAFDLRGIAPGTREACVFCINRYERFFGRPAGVLGREEVETFLIRLVREKKLSPGTHDVYATALRFVYGAAFGRPEVTQGIPRRKKPMRLPVLLITASAAEGYAFDVANAEALPRDDADTLVIADVTSLGKIGHLWTSQTQTDLANGGVRHARGRPPPSTPMATASRTRGKRRTA
jgi:hypothetical protein